MNCTHVCELNKARFNEILWYYCSALTSKLFSDVLFYMQIRCAAPSILTLSSSSSLMLTLSSISLLSTEKRSMTWLLPWTDHNWPFKRIHPLIIFTSISFAPHAYQANCSGWYLLPGKFTASRVMMPAECSADATLTSLPFLKQISTFTFHFHFPFLKTISTFTFTSLRLLVHPY